MSLGPLHGLATYPQFLPVMLVPLPKGKTDKIPVSATTGLAVDAQAPANWMTYETASAAAQAMEQATGVRYGVGWVITASTGVFCLDIDGAKQADGSWSALASQLCAMLPGCVVEISQSGAGLHVWGYRSQIPPHSMKNIEMHLELYSDKRFILLGDQRTGGISRDCTELDSLIATTFPPRSTAGTEHGPGPCPGWSGPADDADLLRRAMQAKSARSVFGRGASFADLWHADTAVLAKAYPTSGEGAYDASSADAALAQHLAFWTGKDAERIERLMRQSKLVRGKWDRPDYIPDTIINACGMQGEVLCDPPPMPNPTQVAQAAAASMASAASRDTSAPPCAVGITGSTFLGAAEQIELFKGCVYILEQHKILIPGGRLVNSDRFRALFGGRTFTMDDKNERTTRNAFEAFTESQSVLHPRADGVCFQPLLPPTTIITSNGRTRANLWWPVVGPRAVGDPEPFLRHMRKLLPNERDLRALLSVTARWVQTPGHKSPFGIVIQGVEGNGKSFFSKAVANCFGTHLVHWPKAKKITAQFNSWLVHKLLICVEDIHTSSDTDVLEDLKPMISGGLALEIEAKGIDVVSSEICCNFLMNTNFKNGIRKTANDRRLMVLWTAQQVVADLARDGMGGEYMRALYHWADHEDGWAIIHEYLATYPIDPEFDPMGQCQRAPAMSMTSDVIAAGLGRVEQEVQEAVETQLIGFCGGWISSLQFDRLLVNIKMDTRLSRSKRKEVLEGMGYTTHPGLVRGRVDNMTLPDSGKPVLYVRVDRPDLLSLSGGAAIARAYRDAQSPK